MTEPLKLKFGASIWSIVFVLVAALVGVLIGIGVGKNQATKSQPDQEDVRDRETGVEPEFDPKILALDRSTKELKVELADLREALEREKDRLDQRISDFPKPTMVEGGADTKGLGAQVGELKRRWAKLSQGVGEDWEKIRTLLVLKLLEKLKVEYPELDQLKGFASAQMTMDERLGGTEETVLSIEKKLDEVIGALKEQLKEKWKVKPLR